MILRLYNHKFFETHSSVPKQYSSLLKANAFYALNGYHICIKKDFSYTTVFTKYNILYTIFVCDQ